MPNEVQVKGRTPEEIKTAEDKKKKEKELLKKAMPQKRYFDVRLEALVPCTITYRVYADDENDALIQITKKAPTAVKPNVSQKRNIKATVYDSGSSMIKFVKAFKV